MKKSLFYHVFILLFFFASCLKAQESQGFQEVKAWMGVSIEDKPEGVFVNRAIPGTPAAKAGLKPGDIIRKL
ncbi:MAG TPA: PDZ domain-containing protein, partial [Leptospiraceae bacterium]|nr:PDZ domain-containing protein [Leptospiraceae bacterium]